MEIRFRRLNDPQLPFMTCLIAFGKDEDGRVYADGVRFSREVLRETLASVGLAGLRAQLASIKAALANSLPTRKLDNEGDMIQLRSAIFRRTDSGVEFVEIA